VLPDGTRLDVNVEQLMQIFLAGAVLLSTKLAWTEGDQGKYLFRELGMAFLELTPEQLFTAKEPSGS
jgi:hypothetical protein